MRTLTVHPSELREGDRIVDPDRRGVVVRVHAVTAGGLVEVTRRGGGGRLEVVYAAELELVEAVGMAAGCPRCSGDGIVRETSAPDDLGRRATRVVDCTLCDGDGRLRPHVDPADHYGDAVRDTEPVDPHDDPAVRDRVRRRLAEAVA